MAEKLKDSLSKTIIRNIKDQSQNETLEEFPFAFNMNCRIGLQQHLPLIKKIHTIYGLNYEHTVPQNWESYKVILMHEQKTDCTEEQLCNKFTNLWQVFNQP